MSNTDETPIHDLWRDWGDPFYAINCVKSGYEVKEDFVNNCKRLLRYIDEGKIKVKADDK